MHNNWPQWIIDDGKKIISNLDFKNRFPSEENVLAFTNIDYKNIKIVILGQDPYPTQGMANGYAFAVNLDQKIPASLKQIFHEIKKEQGKINTKKDLKHWTENGVLLLNTSLTVLQSNPGSDSKIWEKYIKSVITWLGNNKNFIWLLWGNSAKKWKSIINSNKVLEDAHPSPLARKWRKGTWIKDIKKWDQFEF